VVISNATDLLIGLPHVFDVREGDWRVVGRNGLVRGERRVGTKQHHQRLVRQRLATHTKHSVSHSQIITKQCLF